MKIMTSLMVLYILFKYYTMVYNLLPTLRNLRKALHVFRNLGFWTQSLNPITVWRQTGKSRFVARTWFFLAGQPRRTVPDLRFLPLIIVSKYYCVLISSSFLNKVQWRVVHLQKRLQHNIHVLIYFLHLG